MGTEAVRHSLCGLQNAEADAETERGVVQADDRDERSGVSRNKMERETRGRVAAGFLLL